MKLYVTRHGETESNRRRRYAGSTDVPLSETGLRQAEELARRLKSGGVHLDAIVSSTMTRAVVTARSVANEYGLPIETVPEFAERNMGVYEGLTNDEAKARYPDMYNRQCTRALDDAPDGGETLRQLDERVKRGLDIVFAEHAGQDVLVVCHGATARMIYRQMNKLDLELIFDYVLDNCGLDEYHMDGAER